MKKLLYWRYCYWCRETVGIDYHPLNRCPNYSDDIARELDIAMTIHLRKCKHKDDVT